MIPENKYTIILPTLNEAGNVGVLINKLFELYRDIFIIVTDDGSADNTRDLVLSFQDRRIFFLDRKNERVHGLTASILDATRLVKTKYFIVMDADNQHPWERVRDIMDGLAEGSRLVAASRKIVEGRWPVLRKSISYLGNFLGRFSLLIRGKKYFSYDVLTGFFGADTSFWKEWVFDKNGLVDFRPKGYKIIFDFLKASPGNIAVKNIHYVFGERKTGASKLNNRIYMEFLKAVFL